MKNGLYALLSDTYIFQIILFKEFLENTKKQL